MTVPKVIAIAAMDEERAIGKGGGLPWHIPEDMKRFSSLTRGHTVLMGRKTYESLPDRYRPLPERRNVVVSKSPLALSGLQGIEVWDSAESYVEGCLSGILKLPSEELWIIGGEGVFRSTVRYWDELYLTLVNGTHGGDVFMPPFEKDFEQMEEDLRDGFAFRRYRRRRA